MTNKHLILGGSEGIGYAYAEAMAARGGELTLVARRLEPLQAAREALLLAGASVVSLISGDVLSKPFRDVLRNQCKQFDSIFVSGPSPQPGGLELIEAEDFEMHALDACKSCFVYPLEIMEWALGVGLAIGGRLIVVSSSAISSPVTETHFLLSRLFRSALHELMPAYQEKFNENKKIVKIWKPKAVLTPLAISFAKKKYFAELDDNSVLHNLLVVLGVESIPSASYYVEQELRELNE